MGYDEVHKKLELEMKANKDYCVRLGLKPNRLVPFVKLKRLRSDSQRERLQYDLHQENQRKTNKRKQKATYSIPPSLCLPPKYVSSKMSMGPVFLSEAHKALIHKHSALRANPGAEAKSRLFLKNLNLIGLDTIRSSHLHKLKTSWSLNLISRVDDLLPKVSTNKRTAFNDFKVEFSSYYGKKFIDMYATDAKISRSIIFEKTALYEKHCSTQVTRRFIEDLLKGPTPEPTKRADNRCKGMPNKVVKRLTGRPVVVKSKAAVDSMASDFEKLNGKMLVISLINMSTTSSSQRRVIVKKPIHSFLQR